MSDCQRACVSIMCVCVLLHLFAKQTWPSNGWWDVAAVAAVLLLFVAIVDFVLHR